MVKVNEIFIAKIGPKRNLHDMPLVTHLGVASFLC